MERQMFLSSGFLDESLHSLAKHTYNTQHCGTGNIKKRKLLLQIRFSDVVNVSCPVHTALIVQRSRGPLWTVFEFRRVVVNWRAGIYLRTQLYFRLIELRGTREEE